MKEKIQMKKEVLEPSSGRTPSSRTNDSVSIPLIELSSSSSSDDSSSSSSDSEPETARNGAVSGCNGVAERKSKKRKEIKGAGVVLPVGFLAPLPPPETSMPAAEVVEAAPGRIYKQFWKAGDYYDGVACSNWELSVGGVDHVRVHPKFLHSNATSHKWALGAFAELIDNALDEVSSGATYVNIDMVHNKKDGSRMLLIEDNGGGMDPDKMRHCMSLGYSAKSKMANTIGQYGNGFKTSTMRLGADVIVFSRSQRKEGKSATQSIGLLSYTFLTSTGKEDIVVPMLDYEREGRGWKSMTRFSGCDWNRNLETLVQWSPFSNEADLLNQFNMMLDHGTRIIIYNLWEDDEGLLELDFDADPLDIQLRGVNRDEKNIEMAGKYPNSRHFLTYRHSLRSYASILYLRLPPSFRIILRGKDVEHHNIVNDMMMSQEITYRPQSAGDGIIKEPNMTAVVTIGFVKDAKHHVDVQGFNVYHKNRLIKPFWRLWNPPGSDGRGVIGLLEANFVEPAHDKQGFERTTVLARLEARLVQMQRSYWTNLCHKIGYAPRRKNISETSDDGSSQKVGGKGYPRKMRNEGCISGRWHTSIKENVLTSTRTKSLKRKYPEPSSSAEEAVSDGDIHSAKQAFRHSKKIPQETYGGKFRLGSDRSSSPLKDELHPTEPFSPAEDYVPGEEIFQSPRLHQSKVTGGVHSNRACTESDVLIIDRLSEENRKLKERLERSNDIHSKSPNDVQCEKCKSLKEQLQEAQTKIDELNKEQESLISMFSEEKGRRDKEVETLRKKIEDAYKTIQELREKVSLLEKD